MPNQKKTLGMNYFLFPMPQKECSLLMVFSFPFRLIVEGKTLSIVKKINRNEYAKSALVIGVIIALVLGFFFGLQLALGTTVPVRVVESGSMCVPFDGACDGWSHPFAHTLHIGDIIVIQKINPADLNTNYPNSDIIVYENPTDPTSTPIVHRIVKVDNINGTLYFQTKGDGNSATKWPNSVSFEQYDSNTLWNTGQGVPQNLVIGRVVMRIPYFGWITLFLRGNSWGLPVIVGLILLLIVLEFIIPIVRGKKGKPEQETKVETTQEKDFII
jgi:signal peptidase I